MPSDLYFEIAGGQIDGSRDYQEDAYLTTYLDDQGESTKSSAMVVMADGMGGHAAGNVASSLVVSTFNKTFTREFGRRDVSGILNECLEKANQALRESIRETPALDGMGCTMVTAALTDGNVWWVSVGDSHLYLIRGRELIKKNEDHSYGGYLDRMKAQGMDIEPEPGLSRNMLMSAMTGDEVAEVDCPNEPLKLTAGDRVIVASDGLDTLSESSILQFSAWASTPQECVDSLLKAVEEAGKPRQDNTTVVVIDVLERIAEPAAPSLPEPTQTPAPVEPTEPVEALEEFELQVPTEETSFPGVSADLIADTAPSDEGPERESRRGWLIGAVTVMVLGAFGAGAWFFLGADDARQELPAEIATAPGTGTVLEPMGDTVAEPRVEAMPEPAGETMPELGAEAVPESTGETGPEPGVEDLFEPGTEDLIESGTEDLFEPGTEAASELTGETATEPALEFRDRLRGGGEGPTMIRLPGGVFMMGASGFSASQDEYPQHEVRIAPFAIGKFEITLAEYDRFAKATGRKLPPSPDVDRQTHPAVFVSWEDAVAYTEWLSAETGERYRLASEAEWEFAARGGTTTAYSWGPALGTNRAHCFDCESGLDPQRPTRVGRFEPNPFGLHDLAGNVQEWVHDCYHPNYLSAPEDGSARSDGDCTYRTTRGGSFDSPGASLRSSKRNRRRPGAGYDAVGIRVVRDL